MTKEGENGGKGQELWKQEGVTLRYQQKVREAIDCEAKPQNHGNGDREVEEAIALSASGWHTFVGVSEEGDAGGNSMRLAGYSFLRPSVFLVQPQGGVVPHIGRLGMTGASWGRGLHRETRSRDAF